MPKRESDEGFTKDFSHSALHRFKNPQSKNFRNIFPPGNVLHLSNIPDTFPEQDVTNLFTELGFIVENLRFLSKDNDKRKMALVTMKSSEEAIEALIELHDKELSPNAHLRVTFSKKTR